MASAPVELTAPLTDVWERRREPMLAQIATIDRAVIASLRGELEDLLREQARREAGELATALRAFGFAAASGDARRLEQLLGGDADPRALSEYVVRLRFDLERRDGSPDETAGGDTERVAEAVLIVEPDAGLAERLAGEASRSGLRARTAHTPAGARAAIEQERPHIVLLGLSSGAPGALDLLSELTEEDIPVVALTSRAVFSERVEAARRGASGFLAEPKPREAIDYARELLARDEEREATLLAVGPASVRAALESTDVHVETLTRPERFWEELERIAPDLVLIDANLPGVSGIELCRIVRTDRRWSELPVLLLGPRDADAVRAGFAAGADDYVAAQSLPEELAGRVRSRLDRARLHRTLAERDTLTGVANRQSALRGIEGLIALSTRYGEPLTLATIDVDQLKRINDRYGNAAGDAVLRRLGELLVRSFRGEDVVGRWGGEEFLVAVYGMARHDALRRVRDLAQAFHAEGFIAPDGSSFAAGFSAGIALLHEDAETLHALHDAAEGALREAKEAGDGRVRAAGDNDTGSVDRPDVVVVEDDPVIADVLLHALATRGHRATLVRDGAEAAAMLAGNRATVRPRVVLLDIDLPGVNGVAVLRRLAAEGVLKRTNVIMLTGRTAEQTVLETLRLGAFDHLAKPFSIPVLMSRVARALEARPSFRTGF